MAERRCHIVIGPVLPVCIDNARPATNLWADSYLLALARVLDFQVVSFDRALGRLDRARVETLV